jgi:hypothetical protein
MIPLIKLFDIRKNIKLLKSDFNFYANTNMLSMSFIAFLILFKEIVGFYFITTIISNVIFLINISVI